MGQKSATVLGLDAHAAGQFIRQRRVALGLTLAQVVEQTTLPSTQYLSGLESGRTHVGRSRHLPGLVTALALTPDEVSQLTGTASPAATTHVREQPVADAWIARPLISAVILTKSTGTRFYILPDAQGRFSQTRVDVQRGVEHPATDLVVIRVNHDEQTLEGGRHYIVRRRQGDGFSSHFERALAVTTKENIPHLVLGDDLLSPEEVVVFGRVISETRFL
nr:helix-turn-helix transcriptional regulator [Deinococcus aestuarii]